uniref:SH2 domain-containing protein n=1 Tax=Trichuris muris TaxID=70415 RepID=A0A5S6QAZ1_TRIMR
MIRCRVDATRRMYALHSRGNAVLKESPWNYVQASHKARTRDGYQSDDWCESFENVRPLFTASHEARVPAKPYSLINLRSPLAFDHLPYYHGVNCPEMLYGLLKLKGDFLLCTNSITGDLHLLRSNVRSDISVFSFVIQYHKIKEVFFLNSNDCEQWFSNVEELIECYVQYRLPVDGVGIVSGNSRKPINEDLSLVNPVVCWDQVSHLYLEDVNSDHDLSYFYRAIPLENAQTLLTYSGDFLLLYNDNEKLFVLALWGDRFVQIDMEPSPGDGLYKLPTANESEPKESLA